MNRKNPCYDEVTGQDCAERCAECAGRCSKWAEYVEKRNQSYNTPHPNNVYDNYVSDTLQRLHENAKKKKAHRRWG